MMFSQERWRWNCTIATSRGSSVRTSVRELNWWRSAWFVSCWSQDRRAMIAFQPVIIAVDSVSTHLTAPRTDDDDDDGDRRKRTSCYWNVIDTVSISVRSVLNDRRTSRATGPTVLHQHNERLTPCTVPQLRLVPSTSLMWRSGVSFTVWRPGR